ncbi:hypothetical protein pEaSNUABM37_00314 [Erwinia phage pEa_SNUABM_37]|nr:hypothetical protein pEaSNUABM37_00314 [Erwinia phage pEa_SNUABM_37]QXO10782.1 hypothetical protein pEaSNUABM48_00314 [Erwinia phage pEa_SNUABM_48]
MSELVERAQLIAMIAHDAVGQKRKFTGESYWYHPRAVAELIAKHTTDENLIAAAWVHDVPEDTGVGEGHIAAQLGLPVFNLVLDVTKQAPYGEGDSRNTLHEIKRQISMRTDSQLLKLCDIQCNIADMNPACGMEFIIEWLPKKLAVVLGIKMNTPVYSVICDETVQLARTLVKRHFPMLHSGRLYAESTHLLGRAMAFNPEEELADD